MFGWYAKLAGLIDLSLLLMETLCLLVIGRCLEVPPVSLLHNSSQVLVARRITRGVRIIAGLHVVDFLVGQLIFIFG